MAGRTGSDAGQESFLLRITTVPDAAATVQVRRLRTGTTTVTVGLGQVPDAIWSLLASTRVSGPVGPVPAAPPAGAGVPHSGEPRLAVRLDGPAIRPGEPFTVEVALAVDTHAVARPTSRCAVSLFARPTVSRRPPVDIGRVGMVMPPGRYRLETVVELTERREGQVCRLAVAFVDTPLVVSPARR